MPTLRRKHPRAARLLAALLLASLLAAPAAAQSPPPPEREPVALGRHLLPSGITAEAIQFPPAADASVASAQPSQNFGAAPLRLGYSLQGELQGAERIFLRFDLTTLPANAVIHDARLRLYLSAANPASDAFMGTAIHRLGSAWAENTVTWNTLPVRAASRTESGVGTTPGWYEWNVTDLATTWQQNPSANHGLELGGDENVQQRERTFYSRETSTGFFPRLVVSYSIPGSDDDPGVTVAPLPPYSPASFAVSWRPDVGSPAPARYEVQYQDNGGPWTNWQVSTTITTAVFTGGLDGHTYTFRARGVGGSGPAEVFGPAEAQTLVDTAPPTATVNALPVLISSNTVTVTWSGSDTASGVRYYDIRYRYNNGEWLPWQVQTLATAALFSAMADGVYQFEARAVDNAGLAQPLTGQPEAGVLRDIEAPFVTPRIRFPFLAR